MLPATELALDDDGVVIVAFIIGGGVRGLCGAKSNAAGRSMSQDFEFLAISLVILVTVKLIVSTYDALVGAIPTLIITKPVTTSSCSLSSVPPSCWENYLRHYTHRFVQRIAKSLVASLRNYPFF